MIVHCLGWYYNDPCYCDWLISGIQQGRLYGSQIWHEILTFLCVFVNTVDGSEIRRSPPGMDITNLVNNVTNYQPQLVIPISEPSTLSPHFFGKYSHGVRVKNREFGGFIRVLLAMIIPEGQGFCLQFGFVCLWVKGWVVSCFRVQR